MRHVVFILATFSSGIVFARRTYLTDKCIALTKSNVLSFMLLLLSNIMYVVSAASIVLDRQIALQLCSYAVAVVASWQSFVFIINGDSRGATQKQYISLCFYILDGIVYNASLFILVYY